MGIVNIGIRGILVLLLLLPLLPLSPLMALFWGYRQLIRGLSWREKLQRRIERLYGEFSSRYPAMAFLATFFIFCCSTSTGDDDG